MTKLIFSLILAAATFSYAKKYKSYYDDDDSYEEEDYYETKRKPSDAAVKIGIRAGLNLSKIEASDYGYADSFEEFNTDYSMYTAGRIGFHVGIVADIRINEFLFFQPGAMLSSKGGEASKTEKTSSFELNSKTTFNPYYLDFPLLLSLKGTLAKDLALRVSAGPYIGIGLFGTKEWEYEERINGLLYDSGTFQIKNIFSPSNAEVQRMGKGFDTLNFGINLGGGIEIGSIYLGMSYNLGLANLSKDDSKLYDHTTSFTVGYNF